MKEKLMLTFMINQLNSLSKYTLQPIQEDYFMNTYIGNHEKVTRWRELERKGKKRKQVNHPEMTIFTYLKIE